MNEAELASTLVQQDRDGNVTLALTEGTQNLIGQLILASAIEESGSSIAMSLDKLEGLAQEVSELARAAKMIGH